MASKVLYEIPEEFMCPVSMEIMDDPVICEDGHTYERMSIVNLRNSLSPITREPINKKNLIPNRNLANAIERFKKANGITSVKKPIVQPKKVIQPPIDTMQQMVMDRMGALERFEEEQRQKELARREQIAKEKREQERRKQEERERLEKIKQEEIQLARVVAMFNAKDLPLFTTGCEKKTYYSDGSSKSLTTWVGNQKETFVLHLEMLKNIQKCEINKLYDIYKNILGDYFWIKKYGPGEHLEYPNKPYVDFVFDNHIDKIDELIAGSNKYIEIMTKQCKDLQYKPYSELQLESNKSQLECKTQHLRSLQHLKKISAKPREYYYINESELSSKMPLSNNYSTDGNTWSPMRYRYCENERDTFTTWFIGLQGFLTRFLSDFIKTFDPVNTYSNVCKYLWTGPYADNPCIHLNSTYITDSYRNYVAHNIKYGRGNSKQSNWIDGYERNYNAADFEPLIKLGKIIIELIEFLRPDVVVRYKNETIKA
jgi:hypothetical protein